MMAITIKSILIGLGIWVVGMGIAYVWDANSPIRIDLMNAALLWLAVSGLIGYTLARRTMQSDVSES